MGWMYSKFLKRDVWVASVCTYDIENDPYYPEVIFWDDQSSRWSKGVLDHFEPPREH